MRGLLVGEGLAGRAIGALLPQVLHQLDDLRFQLADAALLAPDHLVQIAQRVGLVRVLDF